MKSQDFWARKRQELQPQSQNTSSTRTHQSNNLPWWQDPDYTRSNKDIPTEPIEVPQDHDFSRAPSRLSKDRCANCGSGNFVKPSASTAARCFDCGYIQGREVNDLDTMNIMAGDAATVKVRQAASTQGIRMGSSMAAINAANAQLERSSQGKGHIDSQLT